MKQLTLSHPVSFEDFMPKKNRSHMALRECNSGAESGREPFKDSKDLVSLLVCTQNKFFDWGVWIFVSGVISGGL